MTIKTLATYLCGNREAILRVAASRRSLWLGLLFVLSAGFAREYDGEDLLHEPWHLLIPLGASLVSSFVLYGLVERVAWLKGGRNSAGTRFPFWQGYAVFLSLFWMTAPLAWLYAIPVERFMSAADSVRANLWLLGIVAAWRVVLITRVIGVLYQVRWGAAFFVVMLFSDAVVWIVLALTPLPILSVMGGIRLTESEDVLLATGLLLRVLATLSAPIWLFGTIAVLIRRSAEPLAWQRIGLDMSPPPRVHLSLWSLSVASLLIWIAVLPITQPEQVHRRFVERALQANRIRDALTYMSTLEQRDFPPYWDPPPRIGYGDETPNIWEIVSMLADGGDVAPWVRSIYTEKILAQSALPPYVGHRIIDLFQMDQQSLQSYIRLLSQVPNGQSIAAKHRHEIDRILQRADDPEWPEPIPDWRRDLLEEILALGRSKEFKESPAPVPVDAPVEPSTP